MFKKRAIGFAPQQRRGLITEYPYPNDLVLTLNWVFENQLLVSGILTQSSRRKQFASRRKRLSEKGVGSYLYNYIHLYFRSFFTQLK